MAKPTTFRFSQFLILVGDGGSPEQFSDPCGLTSRGFNRTAEMNDTNVPDCDDPDAPSWLERDVVSNSAELSGSGVVAAESFSVWNDLYENGEARRMRIELGETQAWEGFFRVSSLNVTGERGPKVTMEITLVSDGEVASVTP